jgi:two-component system CheB/CheR fusion protein
MVGNLLQNAAKFTPRGGRAHVSVAVESGEAVIRVVDNGVGMAPEMLAHLFQPFMQADQSLDRSKGGLGLGLALVKGLVELHGGSIQAQSDGLGKGAAFVIRLPLDAGAAIEKPSLRASSPRVCRRVLIIEDNLDAAESLREALELSEHEVEVAYTGPDGIERARSFHPDVILCDIGLPGMDGYEVARAVRQDPTLQSTFLVALSGYALPEDLERAAQAGFQQHLAKPPSVDALERVLSEILGVPRPEASLSQ